jgi:hypothetical protein
MGPFYRGLLFLAGTTLWTCQVYWKQAEDPSSVQGPEALFQQSRFGEYKSLVLSACLWERFGKYKSLVLSACLWERFAKYKNQVLSACLWEFFGKYKKLMLSVCLSVGMLW